MLCPFVSGSLHEIQQPAEALDIQYMEYHIQHMPAWWFYGFSNNARVRFLETGGVQSESSSHLRTNWSAYFLEQNWRWFSTGESPTRRPVCRFLHVVASHTWDHHRTDRYVTGDRMITVGNKQRPFNDWDVQLTQTKNKLEQITGKKVDYFAYPFGVWNSAGIPEIRSRGYKMAFQLATKRDALEPLYTVRRIIVAPSWSGEGLIRSMKSSFK